MQILLFILTLMFCGAWILFIFLWHTPFWELLAIAFEMIIPLVIIGFYIFIFTRPKVKALFSPERGEAESKEAV